MKSKVFIVFVLFFSFVLSADITHDGYYFKDITKIISAQAMGHKAEDAQGLACSKWCLLYSNRKNVYCMRYDSEEGYSISDNSMFNAEDGSKLVWRRNEYETGEIVINNENCLEGYKLDHIGDVDYYNGKIYIPMDEYENNHGVIVEMDEVTKRIDRIIKVPRNKTDTGMPWVAVNPLDGRMYLPCDDKKNICAYNISESDIDEASDNSLSCPSYIFMNDPEVFDFNIGSICQGASFSENGILAVSGCGEWEGVKYYHITDGRIKYLGESHLKNNDAAYNTENEGNTFKNGYGCGGFDWDFFYLYYDWDGGTDEIYLFGYSDYAHSDDDEDGVPDLDDNCPLDSNPEQFDFDNDKQGNACDSDMDGDGIPNEGDNTPYYYDEGNSDYVLCNDVDLDKVCDDEERISPDVLSESDWSEVQGIEPGSDILERFFFAKSGDAVFDMADNCPGIPNPLVTAPINSELISGKCDGDDNCGFRFDEIMSKSGEEFWYGPFPFFMGYKWQPDHDLDGEGDACDSDSKYVQISSRNSVTSSSGSTVVPSFFFEVLVGEYVTFDNEIIGMKDNVPLFPRSYIPSGSGIIPPVLHRTTFIDNRYCWMKPGSDYERDWGTGGYCTDSDPEHDGRDQDIGLGVSYGYSHGSDPKPTDPFGEVSWNSVKPNQIIGFGGVKHWDWKGVLRSDDRDYWELNVEPVIGGGEGDPEKSIMKYTMSSGYADSEEDYLDDNDEQNSAYFKDRPLYARSYRETNSAKDILLYRDRFNIEVPIHFKPYLDPDKFRKERESCLKCDPGLIPIERRLIDIWKYNDFYNVIEVDQRDLAADMNNHRFFMDEEGMLTAGVVSDDDLDVLKIMQSYPESQDWHEVARIDASSVASFDCPVNFNGFHFISGQTLYKVAVSQRSATELFAVEEVTELPQGLENYHLKKVDETLYLFGDYRGTFRAYKLAGMEYQQPHFEEIESEDYPAVKDYVNMIPVSGAVYLAGGGDRNENTGEITASGEIWKFTEENGFELIADISDPEDALLAVALFERGSNLLIVPQIGIKNSRTRKYSVNMETGVVTTEEISLAGWQDPFGFSRGYCIVDYDSDVFPGTYENGICRELENYNMETVSYFDYKFTLAGLDNRLFIGGLTGIRTALINDDGDLENESFKWIGKPVNSIQISGDRLFAASGNEIIVYEIQDGTLEEIDSIHADNPRNIRVKNNRLYAADGRSVSVWNISGDTLVMEREIDTDYKVKDFEIADGKLFVYEQETYWYWFWLRKRTKFEIMDIGYESGEETVVYDNNVNCKDSEMMQDDNYVYLGCKNGIYRIGKYGDSGIEETGGRKRFFRDSYYYNGKVYQTFSGAIHISD